MAVYVNWSRKTCHGRMARGVCVFGIEDLPNLINALRHEIFVNKFYQGFEPLTLDCMRAWIEHKDICPVDFNETFYRDLDRVQVHRIDMEKRIPHR